MSHVPSPRLANGASHAVGFFILLGFGMAAPVLPLLAGDLGLTVASIGAAVAAFAVGRLIFGLSSLFGLAEARHMLHLGWLVGGCLLTAAAAAWCAVAPDGIQLVAARAVQGLGSAMAMLAASIRPFIADDQPDLGRRVGNQQTIFQLGTAVGPVIGGALGQFAGLHSPFWVTSALALCAIPCGLLAHRRGLSASSVTRPPQADPQLGRGRMLLAIPGVTVVALVIVTIANGSRSGYRTTFFPIWGHDVLGLPETVIGIALAVGAFGFLSAAIIGPLIDRVGPLPLLVAGGLLLAGSSALVLVLPAVWTGFVSMVLSTVGASSAIIGASTINIRGATGAERLIAIRNQRVATDVGMFLGPLLVGFSMGAFGYPGALWSISLVSLVIVAAALVARPQPYSATREEVS